MKFGLLYEMQRPSPRGVVDAKRLVEETLEQCILADEAGFDYLWFVEHHFLTSFSGSSSPEVIYGALSRLTKRIRQGSASSYFRITIRSGWRKGSPWWTRCPTGGWISGPGEARPMSSSGSRSTPEIRATFGTRP